MTKKITLLCTAGISTTMLVEKMKQAVKDNGWDYEIAAYGMVDAEKVVPESSIILLGPQLRYNEKKLNESYPDKIIRSISMKDYGSMDGEAVVRFARKEMGDE